jgi:hypothetical protein
LVHGIEHAEVSREDCEHGLGAPVEQLSLYASLPLRQHDQT